MEQHKDKQSDQEEHRQRAEKPLEQVGRDSVSFVSALTLQARCNGPLPYLSTRMSSPKIRPLGVDL